MSASLRVDTETFDAAYDFDGFARRLLEGNAGGALPTDNGVLDWIERAMPLLRGSQFEAPFFHAISGCLTDASPALQLAALLVFEKFPAAPGAERVCDLARTNRSAFGADDTVDVEWQLLRVVGARMKVGDHEAVRLGREEALDPAGRPEPLIAALTSYDPDWVVQNVEAIVKAHPSVGSTVLLNLERIGRDIEQVGVLIAPIAAAGDKEFRRDVKKYLDDTPARAAILSATSTRSTRS